MSYKVVATEPFERRVKRLSKKYKSLKGNLADVIALLKVDPQIGFPLGRDCYKIRMAISSKGKGKSAGARIITYVLVRKEVVFLLDIYDKSEKSNISDSELKLLIQLLTEANKS